MLKTFDFDLLFPVFLVISVKFLQVKKKHHFSKRSCRIRTCGSPFLSVIFKVLFQRYAFHDRFNICIFNADPLKLDHIDRNCKLDAVCIIDRIEDVLVNEVFPFI